MELLKDEDMKYELSESEISQEIHPFLHALDRLNTKKSSKDKKDKEPPTKDDIKQPLHWAVQEMFLVGAGMFLMATQYIVARSLMSDPEKFAKKLILQTEESKQFKKCRDVRALRLFLKSECLGAPQAAHPCLPPHRKREEH